jgi:cold shock CspA family protein
LSQTKVSEYYGKVKKWVARNDYGFVTLDDGRDVYVHRDKLPEGIEELARGEDVLVEFDQRRLRATTLALV